MKDQNEIARDLKALNWRLYPRYDVGIWEIVAEPYEWEKNKSLGKIRKTGFKFKDPNQNGCKEKLIECQLKMIEHFKKKKDV